MASTYLKLFNYSLSMGRNRLSLPLQLPIGLINFWAALLIGKVKETYERPHQAFLGL